MEKERGLLFLFVVVVIALGQTVYHVYTWGIGIPGFDGTVLAGLVAGEGDVGEESTGLFSLGVSFSQILVVVEWLVVLVVLVFAYNKGKANLKKEVEDVMQSKSKIENGRYTELDKLYDILRERKRVGFEVIEKVFEVDDEVVNDWATTLEKAKLVSIEYPRMGYPILVYVEKDGKED